ncbi:MAG: hypothetical protein ACFFD4_09500 [Candidatus Odinarchaeota archaeon]
MPLKKVQVSKLKLVHVLNEVQMDYTGFLITGYKDFDEKEGVGFIVSGIRFLTIADRSGKAFFQLAIVPNGFEIEDRLTSEQAKGSRHAFVFDSPAEDDSGTAAERNHSSKKQQYTNPLLIVEWNNARNIFIRPKKISSGFICLPNSKRRRVDCSLT